MVLSVLMVAVIATGGAAPSWLAAGYGGGGAGEDSDDVSDLMRSQVPGHLMPWIEKAAAMCPQESPALVAAQLQQESGFDPTVTSEVGAQGIAQFMPYTWPEYGQDDDGNGRANPYDAVDGIMALGRFMCKLFAQAEAGPYPGGPVALALAGYNAGWYAVQKNGGVPPYKQTQDYVAKITAQAKAWGAPKKTPTVSGSGVGADAVRRAAQYVGVPYVWGGGTPNGPSKGFCDGRNGYLNGVCFAENNAGFDCSSLVQLGWWPAVHLPRVAADQYNATRHRPVSVDQLQPGDLIFYDRNGGGIDHVVMYYGDGKIIEAPRTGKNVQIVALYKAGLVGATRPA
ncbi:NlpC/P60 family protein [Embleya sp. NBC_00888]|uniref:C40 family peptidase n=1 Tax=Embleya sp. NBC_00888 TaxID=2975960 RepID=UPI003867B8EA|nr:NlpC/P60 family protein [Embleya sp. NBC_00888]